MRNAIRRKRKKDLQGPKAETARSEILKTLIVLVMLFAGQALAAPAASAPQPKETLHWAGCGITKRLS